MATAKIVELTSSNTCQICDKAQAKYSCPRCSTLYCSIPCYQSPTHLVCSEAFYKENVIDNMDSFDESEKAKVLDMLQRVHEQNRIDGNHSDSELDSDDDDDDDEELYNDIAERLQGVDLDNSEDVWNKLNEKERKEFEAFLLSGDVSKFIKMWTPWWDYKCDKKVIDAAEIGEVKSKCPKILDYIKPFKEICSKAPAACVEHNLINVIASYVFTMRYFNGNREDFLHETASYIINLSLALKKNQNFDSFNQAVASVTMEITSSDFKIKTDEENLEYVKTDVNLILSGPHATERKFYLLSALSDLLSIFEEAMKAPRPADAKKGDFHKKFGEGQLTLLAKQDELKKAAKKIEFYLSYAKYCYVWL